ncbi:recombinase family protein [Bulleidia sp. HCP3S3_F2]|uniref:recombinase family protein n=1 Tax=unclassified Bulleidia TaxID=2704656 RepID=UPI003F8A3F85
MRRYHQLPYHKQVFHAPKAFGKTKEDWQIFENTHPAIIDRETFELVQELR